MRPNAARIAVLRASGIPLPPAWRARVRVGDDASTVSDADLNAAGFPAASIATPQDRATAVQAYNDARQAIAAAHAGQTAKETSAALGIVLLAASAAFPPAALALGALGTFWAGSLAAMNWLGAKLGWASAGQGLWTEWLLHYPPQGTCVADGDGNWFNPETGYKPGAVTPWTRELANTPPPALGSLVNRIAMVDAMNPAVGPFARFALPLLYRAYELVMNGRMWEQFGGASYAYDFGEMVRGDNGLPGPGAEAFNGALRFWNANHAGPPIQVPGGIFLYAPPFFTLNVGPMTNPTGAPKNLGSLRSVVDSAKRAVALAALASWFQYYQPKAAPLFSSVETIKRRI